MRTLDGGCMMGGESEGRTEMKGILAVVSVVAAVFMSGCLLGQPAKGPADARVTIIEYSDFECPYCARFAQQTLPQIEANYADRVLFVFRNYPLPETMHPYAEKAAEAGECANDQGKFWEYHDMLFENQPQLASLVQSNAANGVGQVVEQLKQYAASLDLDTTRFNRCLDYGEDVDEVRADETSLVEILTLMGITRYGTPTFFINGKPIIGAYPYDENTPGYQPGMVTFKKAIEEALAEASQ
jgi:protein-disulfide isomerase